ncbi:MAG: F0F1 ATP synthase subunit B' [Alphaproteobacteria bacterium]|nr:F0F1 ATP synthase subunit B' [Alphaproteobacteria bacterium]
MQGTPTLAGTTEVPHKTTGFPPFRTETFPSQLFWLAITFSFLFVVLWRYSGPMIATTIAARRQRISDDISAAQTARSEADAALADYERAISGARARAQAASEEQRKRLATELDTARAQEEKEAQVKLADAEHQIALSREAARAQLLAASEEAASAIVHRLIGETLPTNEVRGAVQTAAMGRKS